MAYSEFSDSNFVFNNLLTSDANATRFGRLTNSVSLSDYTGFNQIAIYVDVNFVNDMFTYDGMSTYSFDFTASSTDLGNLTSHVVNSSGAGSYYLSPTYAFTSILDPSNIVQNVSNVKSRTSGPNGFLGQMYGSNSNAIANLTTFSNYQYAEVTASGFTDILNKANGGGYVADRSNFYDQLTSVGKWNAGTNKMNLSLGDKLTFGIVFSISQQVNNTIPGVAPAAGSYTFSYQGTSYTVPEVDICSAIITMCYAVNFISTPHVGP